MAGSDRELFFEHEAWLKLALDTPTWSDERRRDAEALRVECSHLGEVAERLGCSVFEVQAELGVGRPSDVRRYRAMRIQAQTRTSASRLR